MNEEFPSRVIRFRDYTWEDVSPASYKSPDASWSGVTRHRLLGADEELPFHVRYFEVEPDGFTSFEVHDHQHAVVVIRGSGQVRLGDRWEEVRFGDVVYVAGGDPHQFRAGAAEPLGFLCTVEANRDRPRRWES